MLLNKKQALLLVGAFSMQHAKLIASGNVQGVGFRAFAIRIARSLSLVGYAKNLPDGTVEIVAEGEEKQLAAFAGRVSGIKLALGARVDSLQTVENKKIDKPLFASFSVAY